MVWPRTQTAPLSPSAWLSTVSAATIPSSPLFMSALPLRQQPRDGPPQLGDAGAGPRRGGDQIGKCRGAFFHRRFDLLDSLDEFCLLDLIALRQHDLVANRGLAQRIENAVVDGFEAVARVDEDIDSRQRRAAAQVIVDQSGPGGDLGLRRRGVA